MKLYDYAGSFVADIGVINLLLVTGAAPCTQLFAESRIANQVDLQLAQTSVRHLCRGVRKGMQMICRLRTVNARADVNVGSGSSFSVKEVHK